ncbi:MAG: hypothetical protein RL582_1680 [Bacteroidota bacterium]|jgi:proline dehydrogenase
MVSFDNTALAFGHQDDAELKRSKLLFQMMGNASLLKFGLKAMPLAVKWKIPFTNLIIRNTIFKQFVGGESLSETKGVVEKLGQHNVKVILDYGAEGAESESSLDHTCDEFLKVIDYASQQNNIPFISIKVTGIARFDLLADLQEKMRQSNGNSILENYDAALSKLDSKDSNAWNESLKRFQRICEAAHSKHVSILVDAEETWIQDPVDAITILMMQKFNQGKATIYNTIQLYRHDRYDFLYESYQHAIKNNYLPGFKLVRGAYMEKERERAFQKNYASPIQRDKLATDKDYDRSIRFVIQHIDHIASIIATHNESSNLLVCNLMKENNHSPNHPNIHFSQLYGMSDNITFNLAHHGYSVSKYLPFGPIHEVIPYLLRRAQENSSVSGQTGRELGLIDREWKRRKNNH